MVPAGRPVVVTLTPATRGVLGSVKLRLATAAPFGLLWWSVERLVELPAVVLVAPSLGEQPAGATPADADDEGEGSPRPSFSGSVKGVRAYQHGDSPRIVHWGATAHTGNLMVRENELEPDAPVTVVADLPNDAAAAEVAASRALRSVVSLLESGKRVILVTTETKSQVASRVADARGAGRSLAAAGENPYGDLDRVP
jgi:uncharacterized protein (DUF58 family)